MNISIRERVYVDDLFADDDEETNIEQSVYRYCQLVTMALLEAFPGATVDIEPQFGIVGAKGLDDALSVIGAGLDLDAITEQARSIAEDVWQSWEWIIPHTSQQRTSSYVLTDTGKLLVQLPDSNPHGFVLADDDQTWPGGIGIAQSWQRIPTDDPRITAEHHQRLDWLLEN